MLLQKTINKLDEFARKYAWTFILVYCILVNLTLFQNIRYIQSDEINHVESVYSIFLGSHVPTFNTWSHIFHDAAVINFNYPPLYFYLAGFFMRIIGLNPLSMGLFHFISRILTGLVLFLSLKRLNVNHWITIILTIWWISYSRSGFYVGRPDDLAILLVALAFFIVLDKNASPVGISGIAGFLLGISFLIYPIALIIGGLICLTVLFWLKILNLKTVLAIGVGAGITCLLWLIWIIPYYGEFKRYFLGFVIPEAGAIDFWSSVQYHMTHILMGTGRSWSLNFSASPIFLLFIISAVIYSMSHCVDNRVWVSISVLVGVFVIALLIISRNRYHAYAVTWLVFLVVGLLAILIGDPIFKRTITRLTTYLPVFVLMSAMLIQAAVSVGYEGLNSYGNIRFLKNCETDFYSQSREIIQRNEKVLTSTGIVYYAVRPENPVYWPAGVSGKTIGGLTYTAQYDQSYKWLVTSEPLSDQILLGDKFYWDDNSRRYFLDSYTLVAQISRDACLAKDPLERFSPAPITLFFYRFEGLPN